MFGHSSAISGNTAFVGAFGDDDGGSSSGSAYIFSTPAPAGIVIDHTANDELLGDDGSIDLTVTGGIPDYTFDWDMDGTGDFDDDEDLTGLVAGTYTVIVRGGAGCESTGTYTVNSQLGISEFGTSNINVYPNPTVNNVNIELAGMFQYELVAINGDILLRGTATDKETLSLIDYANGVYFISVKSESNSATLKVVKK